MLIRKIFFLCIVIYSSLFSRQDDLYEVEQLKIGNLALPGSQQPSSLFAFGQNIVDQGDFLAFLNVEFLKGKRTSFTEVSPSILYGIRDNLSLFIELPIAADFKSGCDRSSGREDLTIQLEYAFYTYETETCTDQWTIVGAVSLPSGDSSKNPSTSFGSPGFFLGLIGYHLATDWYYYVSPGVLLTTNSGDKTQFGNQFFYECGIGKNICYSPDKWIFMWMFEFIGVYEQRDKVNGIVDCDSGGNTILVAPSLWFSTERLILQASIAPVVSQHLFGEQFKSWFVASFNIGWKF